MDRSLKLQALTDQDATTWKKAFETVINSLAENRSTNINGQEFVLSNRYLPTHQIGAGAYGKVCAARDSETSTMVAIKGIFRAFDSLEDGKRILRELSLMRQLSHPSILGLVDIMTPVSIDTFEDVYLVTHLIDQDLEEVIFSRTPLNDDQQQWILYQACCGLRYMHHKGVLHRDLKPSNILVNTNTCAIQICDLGLARAEPTSSDGMRTIP